MASDFTDGAIVTSFMFSLVGLIYEIGLVIPQIASPRTKTSILMSCYAFILTGICTAFYGTRTRKMARKHASDKSAPAIADQFGHCLLLVVVSALVAWIVWTSRRMSAYSDHVQFRNAQVMLFSASIGLSFLSFRLIHEAIFAFTLFPSLDPDRGSLATRLFLVFLLEFAGTLTLCVGGWFSRDVGDLPQTCESAESSSEPKVTGV
ncbi:hypothetical protein E4U42_000058 [Claviceps africana]|uniref:Uncharacterized protein n=1 Tax=Claviceps africana TaxID=83212 RepID=A0A8K0J0C4_9HYPO|nr:hypothetical protein E4U42_000058 [Claviceps africana]